MNLCLNGQNRVEGYWKHDDVDRTGFRRCARDGLDDGMIARCRMVMKEILSIRGNEVD